MMLFTTKWLASIFTNNRGEGTLPLLEVTTDSRKKCKNSLFVPLVGEKFDAHDYAEQAFENGAVAFLWNENNPLPDHLPDHFTVLFVKYTLKALQELAWHYRNKVNPIVIGITGSNGKTTTKDLTTSIVSSSYVTHFTKGNLNNHIGLPLTILSMPANTEVLIVEMGMSDFGEIELLTSIARPKYAMITNIGESHIEYLGSREGIAKAKKEIVKELPDDGVVIIDGDEPLLYDLKQSYRTETCGFNATNSNVIRKVQITEKGTQFQFCDETFHVPLLGEHHAKNASFAIEIGKLLCIPFDKIKKSLESLTQTGMRFELLKGTDGETIINDAYNASPTSMKAAIEVVKQMTGYREKVLVLGDILELGAKSAAFHKSVAEVIEPPITAVYTYGKNAKFITDEVQKKHPNMQFKHFTEKEALLHELKKHKNESSLLLFKASRGLKFELLIEKLID